MTNFAITTDNNSDLPLEFAQAHGIGIMSLSCTMDGVTYDDSHPIDNGVFYAQMRAGSLPITAQVTPDNARNVLLKALETADGVLHIGFSSGLSGSYQSAAFAASELREEFPDKEIVTIDSLAASMGVSVLVYYAVKLRDEGKTLAEVAAWVESHTKNACTAFTVDDLNHLYRGGRVSKASAVIGSAIGIKPMLHVDDEGKLAPYGKVRGRKRALTALAERMQALSTADLPNDMVFISHADALEDAAFVKAEIVRLMGPHNFMIGYICPSIGAHAGPGTIALSWLGEREK